MHDSSVSKRTPRCCARAITNWALSTISGFVHARLLSALMSRKSPQKVGTRLGHRDSALASYWLKADIGILARYLL